MAGNVAELKGLKDKPGDVKAEVLVETMADALEEVQA